MHGQTNIEKNIFSVLSKLQINGPNRRKVSKSLQILTSEAKKHSYETAQHDAKNW